MFSRLIKEEAEELFERAAKIVDIYGKTTRQTDGDILKHHRVGDVSIMRLYVNYSGSETRFNDVVEIRVHRPGAIYLVATIYIGHLDADKVISKLGADGPKALRILRQAMVLDDLAQT